MLHDSKKYKIENEAGKPSFKTRMKLTIFNISKEDFGTYKCIAKNPRGETDGTIRLYGKSLLHVCTPARAKAQKSFAHCIARRRAVRRAAE